MTPGFDHGPAQPSANTGSPETPDAAGELTEWLREEVRRRISGEPVTSPADGPAEHGRRLITDCLDAYAQLCLRRGQEPPDSAAEDQASRRVFNELFALSGLQPLIDDASIENIFVAGHDRVIVHRVDGTREPAPPVAGSDEELIAVIRTLATRSGAEERRFDRASPSLSVQLPDGSRMFAVMAVTEAGRPCVTIRRFPLRHATLRSLQKAGMIDATLRGFLAAAVRAGRNIVVAGGTNTGKTTLLRGLISEIPAHERLITIEDAFELAVHPDAHPNVVAMQAREANVEGEGEVTAADLVRWGLRMAPDRVIVGEVRGAEVIPMLLAMSQGNDGSLSTVHASGSRAAFLRLAGYAIRAEHLDLQAANLLIAGAVHLIVHIAFSADGRRVISSIREIVDSDGAQITSNEIFHPRRDGRAVPGVPPRTDTLDTLITAGLDPQLLEYRDGWWEP